MSAGPPPVPGQSPSRDFSFFSLPTVRGASRRWRGLLLANTGARREAKALLFSELAEATRHGMPLEMALAMNSQTVRERRRAARPQDGPGADSRNRGLDFLVAFAMFFLAQLALVLYLFASFRVTDVGRIARLLGLRLHNHVSRGLSLSEAMRRCGIDYDEQEVRLAEAGERWGVLPQTLKRLSEFQVTEARLTVQGSQMFYPLWLAGMLATIGGFLMVFILPKFRDIYQQLGAELPMPTQMFMDATLFFINGPGEFIPFIVAIAAAFFLFRALMNGNRLSVIVMTLPLLFLAPLPFGLLMEVSAEVPWLRDHLKQPLGVILIMTVLGVGITLTYTFVIPELLKGLEMMVLRLERVFAPVVRWLPVVGGTARAQAEARWLAALAVAVENGVTAPEAVRTAGFVCGGDMDSRSRRAAAAVERGLSIGRACVTERVLSTEANHRLVLIDTSPAYVEGLRAVADDHAQQAFNILNRSGRVAEVVSIVLMGICVLAFAIAMYLPLFGIPRIMMSY